jgi:type II secretory pathway pseudopilin PulG
LQTKSRGLSILEVIFAMALLALGFLFVLGIVPTGIRSIKRSEDLAAATAYSVELIEEARRSLPQEGPQEFKITFNKTEFKIKREIIVVDEGLTDVVVTAQWIPDTPGLRVVTRVPGQPPSPETEP